MPNKCAFCGQEVKKDWKFCSPVCKNRAIAQAKREKVGYQTCLYCGEKFYRTPSQSKRGRGKFCSLACRFAQQERGAKVANKVCKNCGKEFTIPNCWLKKFKNAGQYCSRGCWNETQRKNGGAFGGKDKAGWGQGSGTFTDAHGYVHEYDPIRQKFVRQHRLVMERMLGRPLEKGEKVHHKNGKRGDNEPENLELILGAHFSGKRVKDVYAQDIERLALENHNLKQRLAALR